jgi:hypothetical protein
MSQLTLFDVMRTITPKIATNLVVANLFHGLRLCFHPLVTLLIMSAQCLLFYWCWFFVSYWLFGIGVLKFWHHVVAFQSP